MSEKDLLEEFNKLPDADESNDAVSPSVKGTPSLDIEEFNNLPDASDDPEHEGEDNLLDPKPTSRVYSNIMKTIAMSPFGGFSPAMAMEAELNPQGAKEAILGAGEVAGSIAGGIAGSFASPVVGTFAGAEIGGEAVDQAYQALGLRERKTLKQELIEGGLNLGMGTLGTLGTKVGAKGFKWLGKKLGRESLYRINSYLDVDEQIAKAMTKNPVDLRKSFDKDGILGDIKVVREELLKANPNDKGRIRESLWKIAKDGRKKFGKLIGKEWDNAVDILQEKKFTYGEIFDDLDKISEGHYIKANGEWTQGQLPEATKKVYKKIFKSETDGLIRQVLPPEKVAQYDIALKQLSKLEKKITINNFYAENMAEETFDSIKSLDLSDDVLDMYEASLKTANRIHDELRTTPMFTARTLRDKSVSYGKKAGYGDGIASMSDTDAASAYRKIQGTFNTKLEGLMEKAGYDGAEKIANYNTYFRANSSIEDVLDNTVSQEIFDETEGVLKGFVTLAGDRVSGHSTGGFGGGMTSLDRFEMAKGLDPAAIKDGMAFAKLVKIVEPIARKVDNFFEPKVIIGINRAIDELQERRMSGEPTPEDYEQTLLDKGASSFFKSEVAGNGEAKGLKSLANGKILDPLEQEVYRKRIVASKMNPVQKYKAMTALNKDGSVVDFKLEEEPNVKADPRTVGRKKDVLTYGQESNFIDSKRVREY